MLLRHSDSYRKYQGIIRIRLQHEETLEVLTQTVVRNLITYQGADAMAKALAGDPNYKITHIYGEHADAITSGYTEGNLNGLSADRLDTIDVLRTAPRTTVNAEVPLLFSSFTKTTENPPGNPVNYYSHNIVNFHAVASNVALNDRLFVGAGLVIKTPAGEILFAHQYFPAQKKLNNYQVVFDWSVRFL